MAVAGGRPHAEKHQGCDQSLQTGKTQITICMFLCKFRSLLLFMHQVTVLNVFRLIQRLKGVSGYVSGLDRWSSVLHRCTGRWRCMRPSGVVLM